MKGLLINLFLDKDLLKIRRKMKITARYQQKNKNIRFNHHLIVFQKTF